MSDAVVMTPEERRRVREALLAIPVPRYMMARKPPHGAPCTRCGACCVATLCDLAKTVFGDQSGPCPGLLVEMPDGRTRCALTVIGTEQSRDAAALLIGRGEGCDARFNGELVDRAFHAYQAQRDIDLAEEIAAARELWGMPATRTDL